eukprot:COSAG06_NODE_13267_length_1276_cov_0.745964_1_plen_38_part_10
MTCYVRTLAAYLPLPVPTAARDAMTASIIAIHASDSDS